MLVEIEYKAAHYSMSLNNLNSQPTQQLEGYVCVSLLKWICDENQAPAVGPTV